MQKALHVHENLCTVLIPLCKNSLNLPMCFFLPCAWLPFPLVHLVVMLATSLRCTVFFFNLPGLHINYTNMISELYQQMYSHTNIFFTAKLKQALMMILSMFYFLWVPWIVKNVNCAINLSQLRTTYRLPTQTIIL